MLTNYEVARFWSKVEVSGESECWEWRAGCFNGDSYGMFTFRGKPQPASRVIFQYFYGRELERAELVCHHCDNPKCVNPKHLFLGSNSDNMKDCSEKGRLPTRKGGRSNLAKLTDEQAIEIRSLAGKLPQKDVAARYGVSRGLISLIWSGKAWGHLGEVDGYTPRTKPLHHGRKLTDEQVSEIRSLLEQGMSQRKVARMFNVSGGLISLIATKKIWA